MSVLWELVAVNNTAPILMEAITVIVTLDMH